MQFQHLNNVETILGWKGISFLWKIKSFKKKYILKYIIFKVNSGWAAANFV